MAEARVFVGPGRGHRFELPSRSLVYRIRNRGSFALGRYEPEVTRFLAERLRSNSVFADIGAHSGYYTRVALALMAPHGRVVAFEPDLELALRLRQSFDDRRLVVRVEALGRDDHDAVLQRGGGLAARVRGEAIPGGEFVDGVEVRVRSLDGLVEGDEVPRPDILKLDVEGGEMLALEGMGGLLKGRPAAAIECHSMQLLRDVLDLLIADGYDHIEVTGGGDGVGPPTVLAAAVRNGSAPVPDAGRITEVA
jgi:FkbM family methyltransferase